MVEESLLQFSKNISNLLPGILREFLNKQSRVFVQSNISSAQLLILEILKDKNPLRMGDIAKYLSVSMASTTGIVDKLVKNGLVLRASSPDDRRIVNINITPKGRKIVEDCNEIRQKTILEIFGNLSLSDREKYLEILTKIHNHLKEKID